MERRSGYLTISLKNNFKERYVYRKNKSEREIVLNNLAKYIVKHNKTEGHIKYVVGFMFCQVFCQVY